MWAFPNIAKTIIKIKNIITIFIIIRDQTGQMLHVLPNKRQPHLLNLHQSVAKNSFFDHTT